MTIYLDFDGETVDDTSWNFDDNATPNNPSDDTYPTINAGPYSRESRSTVDSTLSGYEYDGIATVDPETGAESTTTYYRGHGAWAPIMGVGYDKTITQWPKGEYAAANETQDDLAFIDSYLPRLGTPNTTAPGILGVDDSQTVYVIADGEDIARHTLTINNFPATIRVDKVDSNGNLLADLTVRGPSGNVVATETPDNESFWSLETTLENGSPTGSYLVEVRSIGWGTVDTGFSPLHVDRRVRTGDRRSRSQHRPAHHHDDDDHGPTTVDKPTTTVVPPTTPPRELAPLGARLTAISPERLFDTRSPSSTILGRLGAGENARLTVNAAPLGATAAVINIVGVDPASRGFISLGPCSTAPDGERTSTLNPGRDVANSVIVPLSSGGDMCIYSSTSTHAVADLTGWLGESGDVSLDKLDAQRVVDSRSGLGLTARLQPGKVRVIDLANNLASTDIDAVSVNVTTIRASARGFITLNDCSRTTMSSLNFDAGEVRGNNGVFALDARQRLCIMSTSPTDVTLDITGQFGTNSGLTFVTADPQRVLDTRQVGWVAPETNTTFGVPLLVIDNEMAITPQAASINLTAAQQTSGGFITSWNCGSRPETSTLNMTPGSAIANGALVSLSASGRSCLFHASGGHLIVDLAGFWI